MHDPQWKWVKSLRLRHISNRPWVANSATRQKVCRIESWTLTLDPDQVVALYSTYSDMNIRPPDERAAVLAELRRIAETEFAGTVTRNMQTVLYTAQRR